MEREPRQARAQRAAPTPRAAPGGPLHRAAHPGAPTPAPPTPPLPPHPRTPPRGSLPSRATFSAPAPSPARITRCDSARTATAAAAPPSRAHPRPAPHCSRVAAGGERPGAGQARGTLGTALPPLTSDSAQEQEAQQQRHGGPGGRQGALARGVSLPAPRALPAGSQLRHLCTPAPPRPRSAGETRHFRHWQSSEALAGSAGRVGLPWQPAAGRPACPARPARGAPRLSRTGSPRVGALGEKERWEPPAEPEPRSPPPIKPGFVHPRRASPCPQTATLWSRPCFRRRPWATPAGPGPGGLRWHDPAPGSARAGRLGPRAPRGLLRGGALPPEAPPICFHLGESGG